MSSRSSKMPRTRSSLNKTRSSQHSSQKHSRRRNDDEEVNTQGSQAPVNEDLVNNIVSYILSRPDNNQLISKQEIVKNVIEGPVRNFSKIIDRVGSVLDEVYGYKLILCVSTSSSQLYSLTSALPHIQLDQEVTANDKGNALKVLILSHIFMSPNKTCTDASINAFIGGLIDIERSRIFGNLEEFLKSMVREKLLVADSETIPNKIKYTWGPKAENVYSKEKILNFVAQIFDKQPKNFKAQYEEVQSIGMEVDEE